MPSVLWDSSHSHGLFRTPTLQMKERYTCHIRIICKFFLPTSVPLLEWDVLWLTFLDLTGLIYPGRRRQKAATNVKALTRSRKEPRREET